MYEKVVEEEYRRAFTIPLDVIPYAGSDIILFRADLFEAGVKHAIGRGLVARAIETNSINDTTTTLVVQGAGNTVTAVHEAVKTFGLPLKVIAVVYNETSVPVRERLVRRGLTVIADTPRAQGQEGRRSVASRLCENAGVVLLEQHEQPTIIDIQKRTFGRRIAETASPLTHFVAGVGTGGTLFGVGSALREVNSEINVIGIEGVGSTLSLWHAYLQAKGTGFEAEKTAIELALTNYQTAGMITALNCNPDTDPDEWFDIAIDFPEDTSTILGIEGLGVGDPTNLIMEHLPSVDHCRIVTDSEAKEGVRILQGFGIHAVESAGANFYSAMKVAEELRLSGKTGGRIATIVTARRGE